MHLSINLEGATITKKKKKNEVCLRISSPKQMLTSEPEEPEGGSPWVLYTYHA